ncbi:hypothetical protein Tco_0476393 [Tanacetum coccineum]
MADTRTMSKLLQAPTEGYEDAIVLPAILAKKFELKVGLLTLVILGVSYDGPTISPTSSPLPKEVEREPEVTKDKVQTTIHVQPPVVQVPTPELDVATKPNPMPSIPYPSRLNDQKLCEKANNQMLKFLQIFQRLHFDLSFADALLYMPKFDLSFVIGVAPPLLEIKVLLYQKNLFLPFSYF